MHRGAILDTARIHRGAILDKARMHRGAILAVQGSLSRGAILGQDTIGWSDVTLRAIQPLKIFHFLTGSNIFVWPLRIQATMAVNAISL